MDLGMKMQFERKKVWCGMLARVGAIGIALLLSACNGDGAESPEIAKDKPAGTARVASQTSAKPKGDPQPKLPVLKLWVGTNAISAEIASTHQQISTGMMFRTNMAEMEGMLFVFPQAQQVAFYMRNTLVPLSCAYIDPEGTILELYDMEPLNEAPIPSKSSRIQYVLEMNQGWFERHNIGKGMVISTERGTLPQTFRRR
jgi:uncharacterized membrane protein (UPF0127 family)